VIFLLVGIVEMAKNKKWTGEELSYLKKNSNKLTSKEIAVKLGRSEDSVKNACRRYKIRKDGHSIRREKFRNGIFVGVNKGKKLPYVTKRNLENNPMNNPKTREKANKSIREGFKKGRKVWNKDLSGEKYLKHYENGETWLIKQQKDKKIKKKWTKKGLKTKKERGSMSKGKNHPMYGKTKDNCQQLKDISERMIKNNPNKDGKLWKNLEFVRKVKKALNIKPNKPEKIIIKLLKENSLPFEYAGDGKIVIGRKNPDFISTNGDKKVIEMHGRAFHDPNFKGRFVKNIIYHRTEKGTIEYYNNKGYSCLVVWDYELKNPQKVLNRIRNF